MNRKPTTIDRKLGRKSKIIVTSGMSLSKRLQEEILRFQEYHPPQRLSKNLRTMLLEFLMQEGTTEVNYLQDILYDFHGLFDLLEVLQKEKTSENAS